LQIATGYTVFANLGDKVSPMPISRVTTGDGRTVVAPNPERKNVLRPDVAYIMDDIMKDVINRGTASEAQAWGFKNVEGKQAFAGKTGTSRDGWFAGFTPEIVCVVYVGFDDGDDLGMKGSDSAMPIWADFMREALAVHPEWNADWSMPTTVRKAEIDVRNGKLIRELNDAEAQTAKLEQATARKNAAAIADTNPSPIVAPDLKSAEIYVSDIPAEFRRVELFVSGTVPNKVLLPTGEEEETAEIAAETKPSPTATPFTTWQEELNEAETEPGVATKRPTPQTLGSARTVSVMICPLTGMRAILNCPNKQPGTFDDGEEPKDFCTFHVKPR
jgi:penicillin-binding protein 1B